LERAPDDAWLAHRNGGPLGSGQIYRRYMTLSIMSLFCYQIETEST
jgi:hypothetical protein